MMRDVDARLDAWAREGPGRPLAVTGVRGCGKTHAVLGMLNRIGDGVYLDYDKDCLESILEGPVDGTEIVDAFSIRVGRDIDKDTIVVIDGIRTNERLSRCLRSLNRLAEGCRLVTIGGVRGMFGSWYDEIRMAPMTFAEFSATIDGDDPEWMFQQYMVVGGMPAAVEAWRVTGDPAAVDSVLEEIVRGISEDAAVDCGEGMRGVVDAVLRSIPVHLSRRNSKFMFSKVSPNAREKGLRKPIEVLVRMGVVVKVPIFEGTGLGTVAIPSFKLYTTDPGILRSLYGMPAMVMMDHPRTDGFAQGLMNNTVLNGLINVGYDGIRCWRSGNLAEVEFVIDHDGKDVPVQVDIVRNPVPRSLIEYSRAFSPDMMVQVCPGADRDHNGFIRIPPYDVFSLSDHLTGWDC